MKEVDPEILRTAMRGYAIAGEFMHGELRERLTKLSVDESVRIYKNLFAGWERTGAQAGGDTKALEGLRIEDAVQMRSRLNTLAARKNLRERSL